MGMQATCVFPQLNAVNTCYHYMYNKQNLKITYHMIFFIIIYKLILIAEGSRTGSIFPKGIIYLYIECEVPFKSALILF